MANEKDTIAKLQQENAELKAAIDQLTNEKQAADNTASEAAAGQSELADNLAAAMTKIDELSLTNAKLASDAADLEAKHNALQAEKDAADKTIANLLEMTKHLTPSGNESSVSIEQEAKAPVIPAPVEMNGKTVTFLKPLFSLNGNDYTAEQAAGLPELIESILTIEGQKIVAVS